MRGELLVREVRECWRRGLVEVWEGVWCGRGRWVEYGLAYFVRGLSLRGVAREFGVSRQAVSKVLLSGLRRLVGAGLVVVRDEGLRRRICGG